LTSDGGTVVVGVDVGGTFTDVVLACPDSAALEIAKVPTSTGDPSTGFVEGLKAAVETAGVMPEELDYILHGTTIATNAILEGRGARTALITTKGFKYVLEIGRQGIPREENPFAWVKPDRPVRPELIFEVPERTGWKGDVIAPLDHVGAAAVAAQVVASGVDSVAVCLINSFANPEHELAVERMLHAAAPKIPVSLSSQVLPVFREYERSIATVLNAYVRPAMQLYLQRLQEQLKDLGSSGALWIMRSNGGVIGADAAGVLAIQSALSGPAAGVIGAGLVGAQAGQPDVISIDIGGTSADVCLIRGGQAEITTDGHVGSWPLPTPMVDIHTIGAGGGSIARLSEDGGLVVGPESAGALPGPACYGRGGIEPTVTDANLLLGRITPRLLGGSIVLDVARARAALAPLAAALGVSVEEAAQGVIDIVNNNFVGAIRVVSVERGFDPVNFALVAFGGAGPAHAAELARLLGMRQAIVPPHPGVLSAIGLLATDLRADFARTAFHRDPYHAPEQIAEVYRDLEGQAAGWFAAEGVAAGARETRRFADLRYREQGSELEVELPAAEAIATSVGALVEAFHDRHRRLYGFALVETPVEVVTLRVRATGRMPRPAALVAANGHKGADRGRPAGQWHRLYRADRGRFEDCALYGRDTLAPAQSIVGPAVIEQFDTTTLVPPGFAASVDAAGNLVLEATS
jgi:N-methylhydantoinase A